MSVSRTLLGLLEPEAQHGYTLRQRYDFWFGTARPLKSAQVYSTLQRLARDGLVDLAGVTAGMHVRVSSPEGQEPEQAMVDRANAIGQATGGSALLERDPVKAVGGADIVVTDTWVSMGKESEAAERLVLFADYTVTAELMSHASPDAIVMHCLPAYRGKEIEAEVLDGPRSLVWDEAENRRHAQKAILAFLWERR